MAPKSKVTKKSIEWSDLPPHCKQKVVEYLDFVERSFFRLCSKSEHELVKTTPLFIKELRLDQISETKYRILIPGCFEAAISDPQRFLYLRHRHCFHDYVLLNRRRIIRKNAVCEAFEMLLEYVWKKLLENPTFTIGTLRLDDSFFVLGRVPSSTAIVHHIIIEQSQTSLHEWEKYRNYYFASKYYHSTFAIEAFLRDMKVAELKTLTCQHELCRNDKEHSDMYKRVSPDWENDDPYPDDPVLFDAPVIQNLQVLILPTFQTILDNHLKTLKAKKMEIWSPYLTMQDFTELLKRWETEDVPVGSYVKIGMEQPNLMQIKGFEVLEHSENSQVLKISSDSKLFRVFLDTPRKICCEVISASNV